MDGVMIRGEPENVLGDENGVPCSPGEGSYPLACLPETSLNRPIGGRVNPSGGVADW